MTPWQMSRKARSNQMFMSEMATYAASLTNAVGKSLEPETIFVKGTNVCKPSSSAHITDTGNLKSPATGDTKKPKGAGRKANAKNAQKQARLAQITVTQNKKADAADEKFLKARHAVCGGYDSKTDPKTRYAKALNYFSSLPAHWQLVVSPECELYMVNCLLELWSKVCIRGQQGQWMHILALIWDHIQSICKRQTLPKPIYDAVKVTLTTLGLPDIPRMPESSQTCKLPFDSN